MINNILELQNIEKLTLANQELQRRNNATQNLDNMNSESEAINLDISVLTKSEINKAIAQEDILAQKINSANKIYDSLSEVREEIAMLLKELKNSDINHTVESLEELDSKSNKLIDKVINIVKTNDSIGIVNSDYLNIFFDGLNSLKNFNIKDDNYFTKLESLLTSVRKQENDYYKTIDNLYQQSVDNSYKFENLANNSVKNSSSKELQDKIINNSFETLYYASSKITQEQVLRLLTGQ